MREPLQFEKTVKNSYKFKKERGAAQPVAAQVLHARGEREGRRLDGGRDRVLQASAAALHGPGAGAAAASAWVNQE